MALPFSIDPTKNWIESFKRLVSGVAWAKLDGESAKRNLLKKIHDFLDGSDLNIIGYFESFSETILNESLDIKKIKSIIKNMNSSNADIREWVLLAARILRHLDFMLFSMSEKLSSDAPDCWLLADQSAYVVPLPRSVLKDNGPRQHQPFGRRGLLYHRVVPTAIRGIKVKVSVHPDYEVPGGQLVDGAPGGRKMGAALFPDFDLSVEHPADGRFLVSGVHCPTGMQAELDIHCDEIRTQKCDTVVWPELTMDPESVSYLRRTLITDPLVTALPTVLVAGSWHKPVGQDRRGNVAPVLNGRGDVLFEFGKNQRFKFHDREEHIEQSGTIHVLVTDRELIAFTICKDFCDLSGDMPVLKLDADLVLVPSMGEENTMKSHLTNMVVMKVRHNARTFIVQQFYPPSPDKSLIGYAFYGPIQADMKASELKVSQRFTTFSQ